MRTCPGILLAVSLVAVPSAMAGPNAGGVLVVHDTGVMYSSQEAPPVTTPPATCGAVDVEAPFVDSVPGRIWKVYAAFPTGSSPRLLGVSWGIGITAGDPYGGVYVTAAGPPDPYSVFVMGRDGWPSTNGASIGECFTGGAKVSLMTELYWFAGYAYGGEDAEPQYFSTRPHSYQASVFVDDAPLLTRSEDPIAGYGSLGFGGPGVRVCPDAGACCAPSGECVETLSQDCLAPNTWLGGLTTCSPNPCPQPRVCCGTNGVCSLTRESDCTAGTWHGELTSCNPSPCPPGAACCGPDGACEIVIEVACLTPDEWHPEWAACSPSPCPSSISTDFVGAPTEGPSPLVVQFTDQSEPAATSWAWDFDGNGTEDDSLQNPLATYVTPGCYDVRLVASNSAGKDTLTRPTYVKVYDRDNLFIQPTTVASDDPTGVPVSFRGVDAIGAISLYFNYDASKLEYQGVQSLVPGETFSGGIVGGQISVQWYDETGGQDPIRPGVDPDTLFAILFRGRVVRDSTRLTFDQSRCVLGDSVGNPLAHVLWVVGPPYGWVHIYVPLQVSGHVRYFWQNKAVPNAHLSLAPPLDERWTDPLGAYVSAPRPTGDCTLTIDKGTDRGGINALDAIKVIRHSTGQEPLGDPYKLQAADVNQDGQINALDAIKIVRGAVSLENLASGDWRFIPTSVDFLPLCQDTVADFVGIRMGDVNGDWMPDPQGLRAAAGTGSIAGSSGAAGKASSPAAAAVDLLRAQIGLSFPSMEISMDTLAQVPLMVTGFDGVGAISLRVQFDHSVLDYGRVIAKVPGITFTANAVGPEIRIEWFDPTGGGSPLNIGADTLLSVEFLPHGGAYAHSQLVFMGACVIGDPIGDPMADVAYTNGMVTLVEDPADAGDPGQAEHSRHLFLEPVPPTWAGGEVRFAFELPIAGPVEMRVYDVHGRQLDTVASTTFPAGRHVATWRGGGHGTGPLRSGIYFVDLQAAGRRASRKFLILK